MEELLKTLPKLAEISDADLGFEKDRENPNTRYAVRVCAKNSQNQICFVKSNKFSFIQILGGGIDPGETPEQAARRETHEEGGIEIDNLKLIGYVVEHRENHQNRHNFDRSISFVFVATAGRFIGTNYMPDEIEDGFEPTWLSPEEAINWFENHDNQRKTHYSGTFSTRRDLLILEHLFNKTWLDPATIVIIVAGSRP